MTPLKTLGRPAAGLICGALVAGVLAATATGAQATPASGVDVLLLNDGNYVDTVPVSDVTAQATYGHEAANMVIALRAQGHHVTGFTGTDPARLATALAAVDSFVIPEQEEDSWTSALSAVGRKVVVDWVRAGGTLVVACDYSSALNDLFGYSVTEVSAPSEWKKVAAAKSPFVAGPAVLPNNDGSESFVVSSLPAAATTQYVDATTDSAGVYTVAEGRGTAVSLGWDWYDAAPADPAGQDGGWNTLLDASVRIGQPSNVFSLPAKGAHHLRKGTVSIKIKLPAAGQLKVTSAKKGRLKTVSRKVSASGTTTVTLKPSKSTLKKLRKKLDGKKRAAVKVKVKATFTPTGGSARTVTKTYVLRLKKRS